MKAILMIDNPKTCSECRIVHPDLGGYYCPFEPILITNRSAMSKRMDWCPLSHPLKRVGHDYYIYDRKYLLDNLEREMEMLKKVRDYEYSTETRDTQ